MRRSSCSESLASLVFHGSPLELVKERAGGLLKGLRYAICYFFKKEKTPRHVFVSVELQKQWPSHVILRLYLCIETDSCRLLLRMARMDMD